MVLPEPFGPISPRISPFLDRQADVVDRDQAAERLAQAVELEHCRARRRAGAAGGCGKTNGAGAPAIVEAGDAARHEIDDDDEDDAEHDGEMVGEVGVDDFEQDDQRHGAEERAVELSGAAEERHDHHLKRDHRVEGDGRVDVGPARRHHRAGDAHEGGADGEEDELGAGGVDRYVAGDGLVVADDAERQPQPRAADQPADHEDEDGEGKQLPVDLLLADVEEDVAADRPRDLHLVPGDDLADEFGKAEGEDDEEDASEPQRRQADDEGHRDADRGSDGDDAGDRHRLGQDRHGVGADAEEGGGGERDVAGRAGEQRPGGGEHHIAQHADAEGEEVAVGDEREAGQRGDHHDQQGDLPEAARLHRAELPKMPVGRTKRMARKRT